MRPLRFRQALLSTLTIAVSAALVPPADAQAPEDGMRGPRFLLASSVSSSRAVALDVSRTPVLRQRITLKLTGVTLKQALSLIAERAGLELVYTDDVVPLRSRVHLHAEEITVAAALTDVLIDAKVDVVFTHEGRAILKRASSGSLVQGGTVVGQATDAKSGARLDAVEISLEGTEWRTVTGADGRYRLSDVTPGSYTLLARRIGYQPGTQAVTIGAGDTVTAHFALNPHVVSMDEIVVAGSIVESRRRELPVPVGVIDEEQIRTPSRTRIDQLFRGDVPGIIGLEVSPTNSSATLFVRGRASLSIENLVKLYIDGVEVPSTSLISALDLQNIKRMELLRGPQATSIYGSDASGGVLLIFTKDGVAGPPRLSGSASIGTTASNFIDDTPLATQNRLNLSGGGENFSYSLGGSFNSTGEFFQQGDNRQSGFTGRGAFTHGPFRFSLTSMLSQRVLGFVDPPGAIVLAPVLPQFATPNNTDIATDHQLVGAAATYAPNERWETTLTLGSSGITDRGRQYAPELATPADTTYALWVEENTQLSARLHSTVSLQPSASVRSTTTVGVEAARTSGEYIEVGAYDPAGEFQTPVPFEGFVTPERITHSRGVFLQEVLGFKDRLFLTGAVRAEYNSNFGANNRVVWAPRLGAAYLFDLAPGVVLKPRISYGKSVRAPDPSQAGASQSEFAVQRPNPNLRPEVQRGFDAGLDLELGNGRLALEATYFNQTAADLIDQTALPPEPDVAVDIVQYQNVGEVTNRGVELGVRSRLGPADLRASYTYAKHEVKSLAPDYGGLLEVGDELTFVPQHTAGGTLGLNLPSLVGNVGGKSARLEFGATYIGDRITEDNISFIACAFGLQACIDDTPAQRDYWVKAEGFVKFRLGATQPIRPKLDLFVNVDNVGNRQVGEFLTYYPSRGRAVLVGFRFGE